jgi:hypothetical protein
MIHYRATETSPPDLGGTSCDPIVYRESFAAVEALGSVVRRAKRAAEESLRRAQAAPEPHAATNAIFGALCEAHLRDREALFAAMRRFDDARRELRRMATESIGE